MIIYKAGARSIVLAGVTYSADSDGNIDIPDHLVRVAYSKGFVDAAKRKVVKPVAVIVEPESTPEPEPAPAPIAPIAPAVVETRKTINNTKEATQ